MGAGGLLVDETVDAGRKRRRLSALVARTARLSGKYRSMSEHSSAKIDAIQAMRGIAALVVVCWHASRYFAPYGSGWSGGLLSPGGPMGVDLFFLISGFIMVVTTRTSEG